MTAGAKTGRPTLYTEEAADEICKRLADGETLKGICRDDHLPAEATVRLWAEEDREGFAERYARARMIGYYAMADELLEIADDGTNDWMVRNADHEETVTLNGEHVQRSRLRVDTRKWLLAKALPKVFGDKITTEHGVTDELAELMQSLDGQTRRLPAPEEPTGGS